MKDRIDLLAGERQVGETTRSVQACNDYLRMGPGRSLGSLRLKYAEMFQTVPPTTALSTLKVWSLRYHWQDRAAEFDKRLEDEKNARAKQIMESGLALDYERVVELKALADFLKTQIFTVAGAATPVHPVKAPLAPKPEEEQEQEESPAMHPYPYVWLRDVKQIGKGETAVTVDLIRFNSAIIDQFRGVLDDLAKETGGRVLKQEVTGKDGGPIEVSNEQRDRAISTLATALGNLLSGQGSDGEGSVGSAE